MNAATGQRGGVRPQRVGLTEYVHGDTSQVDCTPIDESLAHLKVGRPRRYRLGQTVTIAFPAEGEMQGGVYPAEVVRIVDRPAARATGETAGLVVELIGTR